MVVNNRLFLVIITLVLVGVLGCRKEAGDQPDIPESHVSIAFESGSMGKVTKIAESIWKFELADDNGNEQLPDMWRNWWYVKIYDVVQDRHTEITHSNRGWPYYYLPVYTYDQAHWFRFAEEDVSQNQQIRFG